MKISTNQMFYAGTNSILNNQAALNKTQSQLSTGRKILSPSDNPVDSVLSLTTTQAKEINDAYLKNQGTASDRLAYMDTQLGSASNILLEAISTGAQGKSTSMNAQQKQALAEVLKRDMASLLDLANSKDGSGEYIFAGNSTNTQPFSITGSGGNYSLAGTTRVSYNGDDGQHLVQVESSQTAATSESGQTVFMRVMDSSGNFTGRSVFDALQNMIDALDSTTGVTPTPNYTQAFNDLQASLDHVSRIRAKVGAEQNLVDNLSSAGSDVAVQYESQLAKLNGLDASDYAELTTRMSQQLMQLQASQLTFKKTSELSLFDII